MLILKVLSAKAVTFGVPQTSCLCCLSLGFPKASRDEDFRQIIYSHVILSSTAREWGSQRGQKEKCSLVGHCSEQLGVLPPATW